MKATTLQKRIEKNLKNSDGTINHLFLIDKLTSGATIFKHWLKIKRRYYLDSEDYDAAVSVCRVLKLDYEEGNNAPRGGKEGDFIRLTDKGLMQVAEYAKQRKQREEELKIEHEKQAEKDRIEHEKQAKINELENVSTYALLLSKKVDIKKTSAYVKLQDFSPNYKHRRAFYHFLAAELHVKNNDGFRRYVQEKLSI